MRVQMRIMCGDQLTRHRASWLTKFVGEYWGLGQRCHRQNFCDSLPLIPALASFGISPRTDSAGVTPHPRGLSAFRLLKQSTGVWGAYQKQKFMPDSFGGWNPEIKVPAQLSSGKGPLPGYRQHTAFLCVLTWQKG